RTEPHETAKHPRLSSTAGNAALRRTHPDCFQITVYSQSIPFQEWPPMSFISEFKAFAVKGNMVDMAVGIIIGAAFGKIVSSLVAAVIMPPLGFLIGGVDFSDLAIV